MTPTEIYSIAAGSVLVLLISFRLAAFLGTLLPCTVRCGVQFHVSTLPYLMHRHQYLIFSACHTIHFSSFM